MRRILSCLLLVATLCGCSLLNKMAVRTTADVIHAGSDELLTESNWEYFKNSTPANLKMLEGLWFADQSNEKLLSLLIKGHSAYAFGVHETEALKDILLEKENSTAKEQAILHYEKAVFYGMKLLQESGISLKDFNSKGYSLKLAKEFSKKIDSDNFVGVFYLAQAMGSSINLQRDNISKMAQLNHVREMFKWVCSEQPDIERGSCALFQAVIEASTPSVLGGSQTKAKEMFEKLIDQQPYNQMARLAFIQYHLIPMLEEEEYYVEMEVLGKNLDKWYQGVKDASKAQKPYRNHRSFNLFNAIATRRHNHLEKVQKELF